ncbi:olfactory receptor 5F1-like [Hyperolius riggenbachi]|uniref:olfactory receptor 5F1-like n=1 Tax=Hyperolius riggenbachi TaxID=752182 RepID=UPI0035A2C595
MDRKNKTQVAIFEFSGLTDNGELALFLFLFFLLVYTVTIVGNTGMIILIYSFSKLHSPMYYLLSSLSFVDLLYTSTVTPKMLCDLLNLKKSITFIGCALQFYFFAALANTEGMLLSVMSYDRYVAICHPLHYTLIMTKKKCFGMVLYCSSVGLLQSSVHTSCVFSLPFCGPNHIDHFYCDLPPMLMLSCSNTLHCDRITAFLILGFGIYLMTSISVSYTFIISTILRMTSSKGRQKTFSTCSSHIICVLTFCTAVFFVYLHPNSGTFEKQDKVASVFYCIITPMLNPLIYSLRNQEVKRNLMQAMLQMSHNPSAKWED